MNRDEDFRPLDWVSKQIPRSEAEQWWKSGFTLAEALRWREHFGVEEAARWRTAGIRAQAEAQSWRIAGVAADEVSGWLEAGIGFAEALAWHEFGYELAEARRLKAEGKTASQSFRGRVQKMSSRRAGGRAPRGQGWARYASSSGGLLGRGTHPAERFFEKLQGTPGGMQVIQGYVQHQWFDDEAIAWAMQGFEAADALVWKEFGVSPADAAVAKKEGRTAAATIRLWWEAGIPPDEVGAWLGAGFTPDEAAAQRAQGVSADRAAVLRALRALEQR
jgi:hypothetical protein